MGMNNEMKIEKICDTNIKKIITDESSDSNLEFNHMNRVPSNCNLIADTNDELDHTKQGITTLKDLTMESQVNYSDRLPSIVIHSNSSSLPPSNFNGRDLEGEYRVLGNQFKVQNNIQDNLEISKDQKVDIPLSNQNKFVNNIQYTVTIDGAPESILMKTEENVQKDTLDGTPNRTHNFIQNCESMLDSKESSILLEKYNSLFSQSKSKFIEEQNNMDRLALFHHRRIQYDDTVKLALHLEKGSDLNHFRIDLLNSQERKNILDVEYLSGYLYMKLSLQSPGEEVVDPTQSIWMRRHFVLTYNNFIFGENQGQYTHVIPNTNVKSINLTRIENSPTSYAFEMLVSSTSVFSIFLCAGDEVERDYWIDGLQSMMQSSARGTINEIVQRSNNGEFVKGIISDMIERCTENIHTRISISKSQNLTGDKYITVENSNLDSIIQLPTSDSMNEEQKQIQPVTSSKIVGEQKLNGARDDALDAPSIVTRDDIVSPSNIHVELKEKGDDFSIPPILISNSQTVTFTKNAGQAKVSEVDSRSESHDSNFVQDSKTLVKSQSTEERNETSQSIHSYDVAQRQQLMAKWYIHKKQKKEHLMREDFEPVKGEEKESDWWKKNTTELTPDLELHDGLTSIQISKHMNSLRDFTLQYNALNELAINMDEMNPFESLNSLKLPELQDSLHRSPIVSNVNKIKSPSLLSDSMDHSVHKEKEVLNNVDINDKCDVSVDLCDISESEIEKSPFSMNLSSIQSFADDSSKSLLNSCEKENSSLLSTPKISKKLYLEDTSDNQRMKRLLHPRLDIHSDSWKSYGLESPQTPNPLCQSKLVWDTDAKNEKKSCCTIL